MFRVTFTAILNLNNVHDVYSMLDLAFPKPERANRASGLIKKYPSLKQTNEYR
jgi:hypothetical protein